MTTLFWYCFSSVAIGTLILALIAPKQKDAHLAKIKQDSDLWNEFIEQRDRFRNPRVRK